MNEQNLTMAAKALDVFAYAAHKAKATEDNPLRLGNVEFWLPVPELIAGLCYSIPVNTWDKQAVQNDLNKVTFDYWDDLVDFLNR